MNLTTYLNAKSGYIFKILGNPFKKKGLLNNYKSVLCGGYRIRTNFSGNKLISNTKFNESNLLEYEQLRRTLNGNIIVPSKNLLSQSNSKTNGTFNQFFNNFAIDSPGDDNLIIKNVIKNDNSSVDHPSIVPPQKFKSHGDIQFEDGGDENDWNYYHKLSNGKNSHTISEIPQKFENISISVKNKTGKKNVCIVNYNSDIPLSDGHKMEKISSKDEVIENNSF